MEAGQSCRKLVQQGIATLLLLSVILGSANAGMLDSVRKSVSGSKREWGDDSDKCDHKPKRKRRRKRGGGHCHHYHDYGASYYYDDDDGDEIDLGRLILSPYLAPRRWLNDQDDRQGYFLKYPYYKNQGNNMIFTTDDPAETKPNSGRIRFEYSGDSENLTRLGGQLQIESASRFGIDIEAHRFEESLENGRKDSLCLGDVNFTYRFAQSEKAAFRAGVGINWIGDSRDSRAGINLTYGFDLYPCRPLVFSTEFDLGTLGETDLFRFRSTVGIMIRRVETYFGYEYLDIGDTCYNGLIAGLRVSF